MRDQFDWLFETWFVPFGFPPGLVFQGTPEQVTKQIRGFHNELQFPELFLWLNTGLVDHNLMMRQLEFFATNVMPNFAWESDQAAESSLGLKTPHQVLRRRGWLSMTCAGVRS